MSVAARAFNPSRPNHPTIVPASHALERELGDDAAERLYRVRKMGHRLGAMPVPCLVQQRPHGSCSSSAPPSELELLRLRLEQRARRGHVPTIEDLIALAGGPANINREPTSDLERHLVDGWLFFADGGPGPLLEQALEHFSALTLALALRSRDPRPHAEDVDPTDEEGAARWNLRAEDYKAEAAARWSEAEVLANMIAVAERNRLVERIVEPLRVELNATCVLAERLEELGEAARLELELARASYSSLLVPSYPAGLERARCDEEPSKLVRNEIAIIRGRWWRDVDDGLKSLADAGWPDSELAKLVMTGDGDASKGWAFALCPIECKRGPQKISQSITKERGRTARRKRTV